MEQNPASGGDPFDITEASGTGIDPGAVTAPTLRGRDYGRPICSRHAVLMVANGSSEVVTYYRCPVDGCDGREVRVRKQYEEFALKQPQMCPRCKGVACEVDIEASRRTQGFFWLKCPSCGWKIQVIRPDVQRFVKPRRDDRLNER
jgi:hypothetical protein